MTFILKTGIQNKRQPATAEIKVLKKFPELKKITHMISDEAFPEFNKLKDAFSNQENGSKTWARLSDEDKVEYYSALILNHWSVDQHISEDGPIKKWLAQHPHAYDNFDKAANTPVLYRSFCFWSAELLDSFLKGGEIKPQNIVQSWAVSYKYGFDYMNSNNVTEEVIAGCMFKKAIPLSDRIASMFHEKDLEARGEGEVLTKSQILTMNEVAEWYICDSYSYKKASIEDVRARLAGKSKTAASYLIAKK